MESAPELHASCSPASHCAMIILYDNRKGSEGLYAREKGLLQANPKRGWTLAFGPSSHSWLLHVAADGSEFSPPGCNLSIATPPCFRSKCSMPRELRQQVVYCDRLGLYNLDVSGVETAIPTGYDRTFYNLFSHHYAKASLVSLHRRSLILT